MRGLILGIIFLVIFSTGIFAADFSSQLYQESYSAQESVVARLHFNVDLAQDLSANQFFIYSGENKISVTKELVKVAPHDYYFYFIAPNLPDGIYKIRLESVSYINNSRLTIGIFEFNFSMVNRNNVLQLWPPVWYGLYDNQFNPQTDVVVKNLGNATVYVEVVDEGTLVDSISPATFRLNSKNTAWINLRSKISNYSNNFFTSYVLFNYEGETYTLPLVLKNKFYKGDVDISTYGAEESVNVNNTVIQNNTVVNETQVNVNVTSIPFYELKLAYPFIARVSYTLDIADNVVEEPLNFRNTGNDTLHNLSISLTEGLDQILTYEFAGNNSVLEVGDSIDVKVFIHSNQSQLSSYLGELVLMSNEGVNSSVVFDLQFTGRTQSEEVNANQQVTNATQNIRGQNTSFDLAELTDNEQGGYGGWIVLIVVIVLIAILAIFLYGKSRKKQKEFADYVTDFKK